MDVWEPLGSFPVWFPLWLLASVAVVLAVLWRWPRRFWWAAGGVTLVTFLVATVWTAIQ